MKLGVGATTVRVIEEAARLNVPQIVASRRQVDVGGGYTGFDQRELVEFVRRRSPATQVVRDHGGPAQGAEDDDGIASFDADIEAGFDVLHLDVSKLSEADQYPTLTQLMLRYGGRIAVEVGGEHSGPSQNDALVGIALAYRPAFDLTAVVDAGTHIHADRQLGRLNTQLAAIWGTQYRNKSIMTKLHNADFMVRRPVELDNWFDFYNIAPEFSLVETRALLHVMPWADGDRLLRLAYDSMHWQKWFNDNEGTWEERALCAVRYVLELPEALEIVDLNEDQEEFVRGRIRDAISRG